MAGLQIFYYLLSLNSAAATVVNRHLQNHFPLYYPAPGSGRCLKTDRQDM